MAAKLVPGIRFLTSDTGVASAKVSALLMGAQYPIHIGSCVAVDHRRQTTIADFSDALDQLFAQFADSVSQLQRLLEIHLDYPINDTGVQKAGSSEKSIGRGDCHVRNGIWWRSCDGA